MLILIYQYSISVDSRNRDTLTIHRTTKNPLPFLAMVSKPNEGASHRAEVLNGCETEKSPLGWSKSMRAL